MAKPRRVNWNLLHTFSVIAELQSVSKAADSLGRGQPAVSASLKKLEQQLGCQLARRSPKAFSLTEAGEALFQEVKDISSSVDRVSTVLADLDGDLKGTVKIATASHMVSPLLDKALTEFHIKYPKVSFSFSVYKIPEILDRVESGRNAFGIAPVSKKRDGLDYFHLYREYCGFYCGPNHRLFGKTILNTSDLENEKVVTYPSAVFSDELQSIVDMRRKMKFADPFIGVSNNTEELKRMIIAGLGIGPIPVHVAERDVREGLLWRLPPYEDVMEIDVFLVTNPANRPSRSELAYVSHLQQIVEILPLRERTYPHAENTSDLIA